MDPPWVRLTLDVEKFDADAFADVVGRCLRSGIVFTTIAELGDCESNHHRLYELNRTCSADIPERGEFYTYAEHCAERIRRAGYNPSTIVIALDGADWVGMSAASDHRDEGYFFNEMTGVLRSHRGRGIATAMKVVVTERVRDLGVPTMRTFHHPGNEAPIALNRRLGYVDAESPPPTP
jgi:RimJ/RimL family protein N-acetyltransferase